MAAPRAMEDSSLCLLQKRGKKVNAATELLTLETLDHALQPFTVGATLPQVCFLISAFLLTAMVLVECGSSKPGRFAGIRGMRCLWMTQVAWSTVDMTILIPVSFDLARQLGYGAVASGAVVAASQVLQPAFALLSRWLVIGCSMPTQRRCVIGTLGVEALLTWLMVPTLEACNHWANHSVLFLVVMLRALAGGVFTFYGVPLSTLAGDPEREPQSPGVQAGRTGREGMALLGLSWSFMTCLAAAVLPDALPPAGEAEAKAEKDAANTSRQAETSSPTICASQAVAASQLPTPVREALVFSAVLFSAERSFSIGAIEVATSLLLEVQYAWSTEKIGYMLGTVFFVTAAVGFLIACLRGKVSDFTLMLGMAICSVFGTLLFLDFGSPTTAHSSPWLLLFADTLVYSCMFQLTAFMEGIATEAAVPKSCYSLENYLVARNLAIQMPRALGPPLARWIIEQCGRRTPTLFCSYAFPPLPSPACGSPRRPPARLPSDRFEIEELGAKRRQAESARRKPEDPEVRWFTLGLNEFHLAAKAEDVDKTSVNTIMTILSKTRTAFGSNPRALLQARRILKRKQVFLFLRGLYETIVAGHGAKEWLRVGTQQGEESDDSSNSDFKDEEERACDDEDLRIHAPLEVERQMEKQNHPQGLTIIKVLGHFSEYIHFSQMALMCIQVLGEMLRAALRLKESTVRPRGSNLASDAAQSVVLEQVILNHNFVPTALRALYRHPSSPDIVKETLTLLKYLVNEDAGHNEHVQARQQLSSPPLKPLTLMLTVSKLSDLEDRGNLLLCLQVYLIIAQDGQGKPVVSLPPEREPEAALIMTTVFKAHFHDQAVVELMLKILQLSCEQPQLCRRLFEQGLTGVLRSFLRKARRGKVHDSWFE
ncbi:unnamed protein product, partial [Effrenium voratum]